jgi:predicted nucleotidyltransferase
MRLSQEQINVLKDGLKQLDAMARVYLFGSRVDDSKKGGDIDLLIKSEKLSRADIRKLRMDFYRHFGEQKIDVLLDDGKQSDAFFAKIREKAIEL